MDRMYKKADTINVYDENCVKIATIKRVPYSRNGFDWYKYKDKVHPAYIDKSDHTVDGCIYTNDFVK